MTIKTKIKRSIRNYIRTIHHCRKGGNGYKVKCCMCEKMVDKNNTFIPKECLINCGYKAAHKICTDCWWNLETGFARENASHKCPGCLKRLPLTHHTKMELIFIDLTND